MEEENGGYKKEKKERGSFHHLLLYYLFPSHPLFPFPLFPITPHNTLTLIHNSGTCQFEV